jgi:hypothetical protein
LKKLGYSSIGLISILLFWRLSIETIDRKIGRLENAL